MRGDSPIRYTIILAPIRLRGNAAAETRAVPGEETKRLKRSNSLQEAAFYSRYRTLAGTYSYAAPAFPFKKSSLHTVAAAFFKRT